MAYHLHLDLPAQHTNSMDVSANHTFSYHMNMRETKEILKLAVIPPNSPEFLSECIQACFQIRCSEACMKHSCKQSNEKCPEDCEKTA
jgi:hypothetical protein